MKSIPIFRIISALAAFSLLLAACAPAPAANMTTSKEKRVTQPNVPANDMTALVKGNDAFALDLYQALRSQDGNLVYSPFSISLALAMIYAGARGETASQMAQTLHFDLPQGQLHPAFNQLDLSLQQQGRSASKDQQPLQLSIANAVWAEQTYPFLQAYLDTIAQNYGAGVHLADFIHQYEPARQEINSWVSDQTRNKIKDLLAAGTLNSDTRMVLVNAIYFKADWDLPFDPTNTSDAPFYLLDGSQSQVRMMQNHIFDLPFVKGDGYRAAELTYQGGTAAMDIIMPDGGNFAQFEASLTSQEVNNIIASLKPSDVAIGLPKFTYTSEFSLSDTLKAMGMTDAFDSNAADFSGMSDQHDLFISDVIHKAFVAVDEKGTEAAAATAGVITAMGAPVRPEQFIVDHPFIFVLRDTASGQILFVGRVLNPAK